MSSKLEMEVQYLPTNEAYDAWATVYDNDGNMLQGIDDLRLESLLPRFLEDVQKRTQEASSSNPLRLIDFGCGTGRNTQKLLSYPWPTELKVDVIGYDASRKMLDLAESKTSTFLSSLPQEKQASLSVEFIQHDFLQRITNPPDIQPADAIISTLVLEHFPLSEYFSSIKSILALGGSVLITNMHPDMGSISQAGFIQVDPQTGAQVKVRGTSYAHGVQDTVKAAEKAGFKVTDVSEQDVNQENIGKLSARGNKWFGINVWYSLVLQN